MIVVLVLLMLQLSNNNLSCVADFVQFRDSLHTSFTDTLKNRQHSTKETRTVTKSTLKTLTSAYSNLSSSESEYISHTYWNLSCPYEWSKYSCVHQGNSDRAIEALQFVMSHSNNSDDGNRITLRAIEEKFKSTRVLLLGDSLTRQVLLCPHITINS